MKNKHFKWSNAAAAAVLAALMLSACGNQNEDVNIPQSMVVEESTLPAENAESQTAVLVDREGKSMEVPEEIDSIISMAPSITETLVHLGMADKLTAIDEYSAEVEGIPENLPVFDIMAPDTESITALQPDIIFATGMSKAKGEDPFEPVIQMGALMTYIPSSNSIEDIKEDIRFIGNVTKTSDKAEELISGMEQEMKEILSAITFPEEKKKVYFEIAASPDLYSFGTGTFLNEMIELLGAENILADQESWVSVSEEIILEKNPDIIFTNVSYIEDPIGEIKSRNGWDVIQAVEKEQIYSVDKDTSSRANENVAAAFKEMAEALYPEAFSE